MMTRTDRPKNAVRPQTVFTTAAAICSVLVWSLPVALSGGTADSPYVGQERRTIKAVSAADVMALEEGSGVALGGLAKPAELNSYPGPHHVLDMAKELDLSGSQARKIQAAYDGMHEEAVRLGQEFLRIEREIEHLFANQKMSEEELRALLDESGAVHAGLRFAHLAAHLATVEILTAEQVTAYDKLRGYSSGNACDHVPEGHDPQMWRQHHDCEK